MIINKPATKIPAAVDPEVYNHSCNTSALIAFILILYAEPAEFSPYFTHWACISISQPGWYLRTASGVDLFFATTQN
jgi:hypothetical protein